MTLSSIQDAASPPVQTITEPAPVIWNEPYQTVTTEHIPAITVPEISPIAPDAITTHDTTASQPLYQVASPEASITPEFGTQTSIVASPEHSQELASALQVARIVTQQVGDLSSSAVALTPSSSAMIHQVDIRIRPAGVPISDRESAPSGSIASSLIQPELLAKAGQPLSMEIIQQDLHHLHQLGLFSAVDATITPTPDGNVVTYELEERTVSQVSVGAGTDQFIGVFGTVGYRNQNVGMLGQQFDANVQVSTTGDVQFSTSLTNPYRRSGDQVGYRAYLFRDRVQANRFGGGFALSRPFGDWQGTISLDYARVSVRDRDQFGNPLSFSRAIDDDLLTLSLGLAFDRRNHPIYPTQGWLLRLGTEQALPIGAGNVASNRLRANLVQYVPLRSPQPVPVADVLAIRLEAATAVGELVPYWSFSPGDPSFVSFDRVRSYILGSLEYRMSLATISIFGTLIPLGGVVFIDVGSDLGSGNTVTGRISNRSSGVGIGYGVGLRAYSPLGLLRLDAGIDNQGDLRVQLGFGQRF
ncbi:MAG: BamA/TamA family outer membrane protein [Cyanobacteria bacterium]|nr:BamA/TamA family outer membrane protein [Cyanobacteriota bacterium]MDW8203136.1 BamA/TamA family outer membrane protein [Cyanobacteriota bacterium SKYGB_h_bin112]